MQKAGVPRGRLALIALAALSLFAGAWAGLSRLGIPLAPPSPEALAAHGALMVGGVLGTLIALERAVALGRGFTYLAPLASGSGAVATLAGADYRVVTWAFVTGSALFVAANLLVLRRQFTVHALVMLIGAAAWAAGNLVWALDLPMSRAVPLWIAFLVLTICGERLELSRMLAPPRAAVLALGIVVLALSIGTTLAIWQLKLGGNIAGVSLIALVAWFSRYDLARRTLRLAGLPRYAAAGVLIGYVWLGVAGVLLVVASPLSAGLAYDATLHAVFLGFVFSMVFAHAPIILPAVLRIELPYAPALYLPLALLHASVAIRISADLLGYLRLRQWGGALNVLSIVAFALTVIFVRLKTSR